MYRFRDTLPIDISEQTISGDLVTIENPEEMGVVDSLEVSLSPIQSGSGEPSPSNVRPISGRTEVVTHRTGKNLLKNSATSATISGVTFTVNADGSITTRGTATATVDFWITGSAYYEDISVLEGKILSGCPSDGSSSTYRLSVMQYGDGSAGRLRRTDDFGSGASLSVADGAKRYAVSLTVYSGTNVDELTFYPMIRESGQSATYEPYQGETYTTALGRTVYSGTIDVISGELTVDTAMVTFDGSESWSGSVANLYYVQLDSMAKLTDYRPAILCDKMSAYERNGSVLLNAQIGITGYVDPQGRYPNQNWIYLQNRDCANVSELKTWLASNPLQVVYELATPQTYQLTPQQIELLVGENHLWSDGEISVVWHKDLTKGRILPTEAVSINGQYIENVLDGYRTLYTKGRESLGAELNTYSVGTADGEKFKNKRYPARELTVGFQLIADNAEDFREKFNNLNNLLSLDEADFIFHDEEDKFFSGYPIMNAEVEAGENSVKGEWKIYCAYPFKRSVDPITLTMADATVTNTTATFTIDYKGSQPARPVLRAKFAGAKSGGSSGEDGDCGFVAFMDARENIIQLGNPEVLDLDAYAKAGNLINYEFINTSGWTMTGGHRYKGTVTGTVATSDTVDAFWDGGAGQTQSYAKPSYGSGTGLHGSILWKNTAGASNFTLSAVHRLCVNNSNEVGIFELGAYNHSTGKMTAGFVIDKSGNGTTGVVRYIVNAKQVGTDQIDLSYYNTHFGYCNRTPVYVTQKYKKKTWVKVKVKVRRNKYKTKSKVKWVTKTRKVLKKYNYTQSNLNSSIKKDGINVYFQVGNLPRRTFNVPEIEQIVSHDASCYMGTYGTEMNTNMIHSMMFRKETGAVFAEQPNVFTAGDIVEADCNEATVNIYRAGSIGGHLEPQYGALGNDWESFKLTSGENIIRATWSDWVNPTYKPQIEIEYNEVFI